MKFLLVGYAFLPGKKIVSRLKYALLLLFSSVYLANAQTVPWTKQYGGPGEDVVSTWIEVPDGYILGGSSSSGIGGQKTQPNVGDLDYWIVKIDKNGNKIWDKTYGGAGKDELKQILPTPQGFLLLGTSSSSQSGDKSENSRGLSDFWAVSINSSGTKIWDKTYGGAQNDVFAKAVKTIDGYILAGSSFSGISGEKSEALRPFSYGVKEQASDYWIIGINSSGQKLWDKAYGGEASDQAFFGAYGIDVLSSIVPMQNGFLLVGSSDSYPGYEKTSESQEGDLWIIKISQTGVKEWDRAYIRAKHYNTIDAISTTDGGCLISGSDGYEDMYFNIFRLDQNGADAGYFAVRPDAGVFKSWVAQNSVGPVLVIEGYFENDYLYQFDWQEHIVFTKLVPHINYMNFSSDGDIITARLSAYSNPDYLVEKFDLFNYPPASAKISFYYNSAINIDLLNFNERVTKLEVFLDGVKVGEDFSGATYASFFLRGVLRGMHTAKAVMTTASGKTVETEHSSYVSPHGVQEAEDAYIAVNDPGSYKITEEKFKTLSKGSSVTLWDKGDKVKYQVYHDQQYIIKVRVRSGHGSTPQSYWPNGYTFSINGTQTKFTGDPGSVSAKDPSYGGSYWGFMVSPVIAGNEIVTLEVQSNAQWAGIDLIEVVPLINRYEAENNPVILNDPGTNLITGDYAPTMSSFASLRLWDKGDQARITFPTETGAYILKARVRSGYFTNTASVPSSYWPNGYSFAVDGVTKSLVGDKTTLSGKDPAYGNSYWGTMVSAPINFTTGNHTLDIKAIFQWCGVDYVQVEMVTSTTARIAADESTTQPAKGESVYVYPNPFNNTIHLSFNDEESGAVNVSLADSYGKVFFKDKKELKGDRLLEFHLDKVDLKPGIYILKVTTSRGEKTYRMIKE
jgi:hypothetical protein